MQSAQGKMTDLFFLSEKQSSQKLHVQCLKYLICYSNGMRWHNCLTHSSSCCHNAKLAETSVKNICALACSKIIFARAVFSFCLYSYQFKGWATKTFQKQRTVWRVWILLLLFEFIDAVLLSGVCLFYFYLSNCFKHIVCTKSF